ncbi:MAG: gliding motility-associated C-terminal domain-containing protein [Bacteroidota bacterium]
MYKHQTINRKIGLLLLPVMILLACTSLQAQTDNLSVVIDAGTVTCNGGNNGGIAAQPDGGSPPYTYLWNTGQTDQILAGLTAGTYTVTVTDQLGTTVAASGIVTEPPALDLFMNANFETCVGSSDATATVQTTGGTFPYSYLWSDGQTDFTATNLSAGIYTVTVTDAQGCSDVGTVEVELSPEGVWIMLSMTPVSCPGGSDGTAYVGPMTGTPPYMYLWSNGDTTNNPGGLTAGTYTVTVTDLNGCTAADSIEVTQANGTPLNLVLTANFETCIGSNDAQAVVETTGGTFPYTYLWSDGQTTFTAVNLSAGTYTVTVTDANGCSAVGSIEVEISPEGVWIMVSSTPVTCNGGSDGTAYVNPMTGTAPYDIIWSNGDTTNNPGGLTAGTYTVTVTDANGCSAVDSVAVTEPPAIGIDLVAQGADCGQNNGSVTVNNVFGGTPGYTYLWSNGETTASISGLAAGSYTLTVTDANDCTAVRPVEITGASDIAINLMVQPEECGMGNGAITITSVSGGVAPYSFLWSNGEMTQSISGLTAGIYGVTVTDANNCTLERNGILVMDDCPLGCQDAVIANVVVIEANCNATDGSITVNMVGGNSSYNYNWVPNVSTTNMASNLAAGTYIVTAIDINDVNCSISDTITVGTVGGPMATLVQTTPATCNEKNGTATFSPATLTYVWSSGEVGNNATMLMAGSNQVTITDPVTNCATVREVIIGTINPLMVRDSIEQQPDCGQANGIVSILVSGGSTNYDYLWNDGDTNARRTDLSGGTWTVTVTDRGPTGCVREHTFVLLDDVPGADLTVDAVVQTSCPGAADATVNISYTLSPGFATPETVIIRNTNGSVSTNGSLAPGNYCVEIRDANNCVAAQACFEVIDATQIDLDVALVNKTCTEGGSIILTTIGGAGGYTYDWADLPGTDNPRDRTGLDVGTYSVTVTDANGCTAFANDLPIADDCTDCNPPIIDNVVVIEAHCEVDDGSITFNMVGGLAGLTFTWEPNVSTSSVATGLGAGTYFVAISSDGGNDPNCTIRDTVTVGTADGPEATLVQKTPATCNESNGTATFSPLNYVYSWSNGETGNNATMLPAGNNQVTITDTVANCSTVEEVFIETVNPLVVRDSIEQHPDCGQANGIVSILVSNGSFDYGYLWNDGDTTARRTDLPAGTYTVTVTDRGPTGCTRVHTFVLTDDVPGADVTVDSIVITSCAGINDGMVNFTYTLSPGFATPETVVIRDMTGAVQANGSLSPGTYCIEIRDANDCLAGEACFEVRYPEQIDVDVAIIEEECVDKGSITLVTTGGTGPYTYDWADIAGPINMQNRTGLLSGTYAFTVTDANGCTAFASGLIVADSCNCTPPVLESVVVIESECGMSNGRATVLVSGNPNDYSYEWTPDVSASFQAFSLAAGTYSVRVVDLNDEECYLTETFTVDNADGPDSPFSMTPANCGAADGSVSFDSTSYVYEWSDMMMGNPRSDLAAGTYFVTITDPADTTCFGVVTVEVEESNDLEATATIDRRPDCNQSNGEVTITPNGVGPYEFIWLHDNTNAATRDDLSSGIYQVRVVDHGNNDCETLVEFLLINSVAEATINIAVNPVSTTCVDSNDGRIDFDFMLSPGFVGPASIRIENADGTNFVNGSLAPGNYCVIIRDANGCIAGGDCFRVLAPSQIDLDLAVRRAECGVQGSILVTDLVGGNGGYTFDWSDLGGSDDPQDRPALDAGNYGLTVTDSKGCTVSAAIIIDQGPDLELTGPGEVVSCDSTATLTASSNQTNTTYVWLDLTGDTLSQTDQLTTDSAGVYFVVASSGNCQEEERVVLRFSNPTINIEGPSFICQGVDEQLVAINNTAGDTLDYVWTPSSIIASGAGTDSVTINSSTPGTTTVFVETTNQFGCVAQDSFTVSIIDTTVNADLIVTQQCDPLLVEFSVPGVNLDFYQWNFGDPTDPNATATGSPVTYTYPDSGTYTVILTVPVDAACPFDTIRKDVFVAQEPLFDLDFGFEYEECSDVAIINFIDSTTHQLSTVDSWSWTFSNDTSSTDQNPTITVTESQQLEVKLVVKTATGCTDSITQIIDINLLEVDLPDTVFACVGSDASLNPNPNTTYTYFWTPDTDLDDRTSPNPTVMMASANQLYNVVIADSAGVCSIEDSVQLIVRSSLMDLRLTGDSIACSTDDVELIAVSGNAVTFDWATDPNFNDLFGDNGDRQMVEPGDRFQPLTYYVRATDAFGCSATDSMMVTNYDLDLGFDAPEYLFCVGDMTQVVVNSGGLAPSVNDSVVYSWTPENIITDFTIPNAPEVAPTETTMLTVSALNRFGCRDTTEVELRVLEVEAVTLSADPDSSCEAGSEIQLIATPEVSGYSYTWSASSGENVDAVADPIVRPEEDTEYIVTVEEPELGCFVNQGITITVTNLLCDEPFIFVPNAFTPNGDDRNDVLKVEGFNIDELYFVIYNRWGEKVFETKDKSVGWDGTFNGKNLSSDVFGYYLEALCTGGERFTKQGNVSLLR